MRWPTGFDRTTPMNRVHTSKFQVSYSRTKSQLRDELERMEVSDWWLDEETGSRQEPGVVVRWIKNGEEYAAACDRYLSKRDNLREIFLWIEETRKRGDRPVVTGGDNFAAAALPSGKGQTAIAVSPVRKPHEVLGVAPDAPREVVEGAARSLKAKHHPDNPQGDEAEFKAVVAAEKQMLKQQEET